MDARKILIIDGHPDPSPERFVHALTDAYARGASGHQVRRLKLSELDIPFLRSAAEWMTGEPPVAMVAAQTDIAWADHLVIFYPLWLGDVPALLKAFLEQVMRPGFALQYREHGLPKKLLAGRSARVVVTMGMPAFFYRLVYGAHSVKSLDAMSSSSSASSPWLVRSSAACRTMPANAANGSTRWRRSAKRATSPWRNTSSSLRSCWQ